MSLILNKQLVVFNFQSRDRPCYFIVTANAACDQSQLSKRLAVIGRTRSALTEVNFSKLTHNNQIFTYDFVISHYHVPVKF